jgi:hypothetical protein
MVLSGRFSGFITEALAVLMTRNAQVSPYYTNYLMEPLALPTTIILTIKIRNGPSSK